jgi:hypothetical protein
MKCLLLATSLLITACAGDVDKPAVDAAPPAGAFGAACATASDTSTECTSGVCTSTIDQVGHPVCSQTCTVDTTCPAGSTGVKKCNGKGYCKP